MAAGHRFWQLAAEGITWRHRCRDDARSKLDDLALTRACAERRDAKGSRNAMGSSVALPGDPSVVQSSHQEFRMALAKTASIFIVLAATAVPRPARAGATGPRRGTGGQDGSVHPEPRFAQCAQPAHCEIAGGQGAGRAGDRDPRLSEHQEGRIHRRGSVRRGDALPRRQGRGLLQHGRRFLRAAGRRAGVRLCDVLHERDGAAPARQGGRIRDRRRARASW